MALESNDTIRSEEIDFVLESVTARGGEGVLEELQEFFDDVKGMGVTAVLIQPVGSGGRWPVLRLTGREDNLVQVLLAHGYEDNVETMLDRFAADDPA